MKEIGSLVWKDLKLEIRQRNTINTTVLYVISTVFLCYMSFMMRNSGIEPIVWNTLFWIILLFAAVNSVSNSFQKENTGRHLYYFQIANPGSIILAKIIYNFILLLVLAFLGYAIYLVLMGNPVQDHATYMLSLLLGALGFSGALTLVSGISNHTDNASGMMAVLSLPIILPIINMLVKLSKNALDGLEFSSNYDEILTLLGIDFIVITLSYLLFPYLWKS